MGGRPAAHRPVSQLREPRHRLYEPHIEKARHFRTETYTIISAILLNSLYTVTIFNERGKAYRV